MPFTDVYVRVRGISSLKPYIHTQWLHMDCPHLLLRAIQVLLIHVWPQVSRIGIIFHQLIHMTRGLVEDPPVVRAVGHVILGYIVRLRVYVDRTVGIWTAGQHSTGQATAQPKSCHTWSEVFVPNLLYFMSNIATMNTFKLLNGIPESVSIGNISNVSKVSKLGTVSK